MGLITENNRQYYAGAQQFQDVNTSLSTVVATFDTALSMGSATSYSPSDPYYPLNNFKVYNSVDGGNTFTEWTDNYAITVVESSDGILNSTLTFLPGPAPAAGDIFVIN